MALVLYIICNISNRCAKFNGVPAGCSLQSDPEDGCCVISVCVQPSPRPGQEFTPVPTAAPKPVTGHVYFPTASPIPGQPLPTPHYPIGMYIPPGISTDYNILNEQQEYCAEVE